LNLELLEIAGRIDAGVVKTSGRRRGSPFVLVFASAGGILSGAFTPSASSLGFSVKRCSLPRLGFFR